MVSAEALFTLTDLCEISPDEAIASAVRAARTITTAAVSQCSRLRAHPRDPGYGTWPSPNRPACRLS